MPSVTDLLKLVERINEWIRKHKGAGWGPREQQAVDRAMSDLFLALHVTKTFIGPTAARNMRLDLEKKELAFLWSRAGDSLRSLDIYLPVEAWQDPQQWSINSVSAAYDGLLEIERERKSQKDDLYKSA